MRHLSDMALFVEVVRAMSFRGAASTLRMPSSTLSRRIDALERTIGLRLLNRTTRRIELTEAGQIYFERSKRIVDEARLAHEELGQMVARPSGVLRVSLPIDFARVFVAPHLPAFSRSYPDILFELDLTPKRIDLVTEPFDLAIRMGALPDSRLIARKLAEIPRFLYASPTYIEARGLPETPEDLTAHECFLFPEERDWKLTQDGRVKAIKVNGSFRLNNVGLMRDLAVEGLGIAMLSSASVAADLKEGRLLPVLPEWAPLPIPVHALTETRLIPARAQRFIEFLRDRLHGDQSAFTQTKTGLK